LLLLLLCRFLLACALWCCLVFVRRRLGAARARTRTRARGAHLLLFLQRRQLLRQRLELLLCVRRRLLRRLLLQLREQVEK